MYKNKARMPEDLKVFTSPSIPRRAHYIQPELRGERLKHKPKEVAMYTNMAVNRCACKGALKVEKPVATGFSVLRLFLHPSAPSICNIISEVNIFQFSSSFRNHHFAAHSSNPLPHPAPLRNLTDK